MKLKTVVISLQSDHKRRIHIKKELEKCNLYDYIIVDGVDGTHITELHLLGSISLLSYNNDKKLYDSSLRLNGNGLLKGEMGCAWSHLNVYEMLLKDDIYDAYLVVEDDIELAVSVDELKTCLEELNDITFDVCHINKSQWYDFNRIKQVSNNFWIPERRYFNNTGSYIVTKTGARKLLNFTHPYIGFPSDDLLSYLYIKSHDFNVIVPSKFLFKSDGYESTIYKINNLTKNKVMKIALTDKDKDFWITSTRYCSIGSFTKFMKYFFPFIKNYEQSDNNIGDIYVYGIQDTEIPKNKVNIILCNENTSHWPHYNHYNKYGDYGDENITIYLYNHIDKLFYNEKIIAIPIIYVEMDYLKLNYKSIIPTVYTPFKAKKFCLIATNITNDYKKIIDSFLNSINKCDYIVDYLDILGDKSCYHSEELLNVFNQYKFVFVSENSICDGYITEKIFNCYFSRTIPIYFGSNKIDYFFNNKSFINMNSMNFDTKYLISELLNDETKYNNFISNEIINEYDDENYQEIVKNYL